jgi:hypothetical protein
MGASTIVDDTTHNVDLMRSVSEDFGAKLGQ